MLQTLAEDRKKKEKDPEFMKNEQKLNASVQAVVEKKKIKKYATIVEKNFNQDQAESNFGVINESYDCRTDQQAVRCYSGIRMWRRCAE